jgi:hypothetical protein
MYGGTFMDVFDIVQILGKKFLNICHVFLYIFMKFLRLEKLVSWRLQILLYL